MSDGFFHFEACGHKIWVIRYKNEIYIPSMWVRLLALVSIKTSGDSVLDQYTAKDFIGRGTPKIKRPNTENHFGRIAVCSFKNAMKYIGNARKTIAFNYDTLKNRVKYASKKSRHLGIGSDFPKIDLELPSFLKVVVKNEPDTDSVIDLNALGETDEEEESMSESLSAPRVAIKRKQIETHEEEPPQKKKKMELLTTLLDLYQKRDEQFVAILEMAKNI